MEISNPAMLLHGDGTWRSRIQERLVSLVRLDWDPVPWHRRALLPYIHRSFKSDGRLSCQVWVILHQQARRANADTGHGQGHRNLNVWCSSCKGGCRRKDKPERCSDLHQNQQLKMNVWHQKDCCRWSQVIKNSWICICHINQDVVYRW